MRGEWEHLKCLPDSGWSAIERELHVCPVSETVLGFIILIFNRSWGELEFLIFLSFQCCAPETCEESSVWGFQRLYLAISSGVSASLF